MRRFYVYEHWRPDKNVCFYVGKGVGKRAYDFRRPYNRRYAGIVRKLVALGLRPEARIIEVDLDEEGAFELERQRVAFWRGNGAELANLTDGGDGLRGLVRTEEHCRKISAARMGHAVSTATRAKISASLQGKGPSDETRAKLSAAHQGSAPTTGFSGKRHSPKSRSKISAAQVGHAVSQEARAKIRAARARQTLSDETRQKLSASSRGRKHTEEARTKISKANSGVPVPEERRARIAATLMGRALNPQAEANYRSATATPEHGAKIAAAHARRRAAGLKNKPCSEERKAKIAAALRATWAAKRAAIVGEA